MNYVAALYNYGSNTVITDITGPFDTEVKAEKWAEQHQTMRDAQQGLLWRVQRVTSPEEQ